MGIFKKPKSLMIIGAVLLVAIVLATLFFFLLQPKTVGFFGLDRESEETARLQELLEDNGYTVYYAENLEDLESADCQAWVVHTTSDIFAQKILDVVGEKAIFTGSKPSLSQPVRFAGWDMEEAGALLVRLLASLPNFGDSNEDGMISCLLLTAPEGYREKEDWEQGLNTGFERYQLSYGILDVQTSPLTKEEGLKAAVSSLSAYGRDIEVIMTSSEVLAESAAQAINQGGWLVSEDFYLLSVGHTETSLNALHERQRSGLVCVAQADFDDLLLDAITDTINGKAPKDYLVPLNLYTNTTTLH